MPELDAYNKKRDFSITPEPPPGAADPDARDLVFVVQQHAATGMHWDLRLEAGGVLKSWALPHGPSLNPQDKRMAAMTEDHTYAYRTFEGVIPKGQYGAGQMIVWDEGIYTPDEGGELSWGDREEGSRRMLEGIAKGKLSFTLKGTKLRGSFTLVKTSYSMSSWLFIKHKDEYVSERDVLQDDQSVRSGLSIVDLKEGRLPGTSASPHPAARPAPIFDSRKERPMLSTLVEKAFDRPGWIWEPKLDGIRILAFINDGEVELRSRRGIDVTKQYPGLVAGLKRQPVRSMVLDGEVCALDDGVPRFHLIQPRINLTKGVDMRKIDAEIPVVYYAFDLLYLDGYDLRQVPLSARKELMQRRFRPEGSLLSVTYVDQHSTDLADAARNLGFEGVVGKRAESRYEFAGRSKSWLKVKTVQEQEFIVGGYTKGEGARRSTFGALAIGYYEGETLKYATNVGSGFNDKDLADVTAKLKELETDASPFDGPTEGKPTWVQPKLVVQVKFAEWTHDGHLRAPVFEGLRDDIDPRQVGRERATDLSVLEESAEVVVASDSQPAARVDVDVEVAAVLSALESSKANLVLEIDGHPIKLTNLDKAFWPAHGDFGPLTKRDLIRYYTEMAPVALPHYKDRPLTLTRYPNGITGELFYQKHYAQPIPDFVDTVKIWSTSNNVEGEYILCNNLATLVWLAQIADLELHAWMASVNPEPDAIGRPLTFSGSEEALEESILNYPDYMVFDLDPYIYSGQEGKGAEPEYNRRGWQKTVELAHNLKELLDQLKLSSFIKTSGKTGLHIYVPLLRHFDYDQVRAATQTLGRFLVQQHPKDVTMEWDTSKRNDKVFFDHNQNMRGKTLAGQYSLRPTAWAGVSTPIAWSELAKLDPVTLNLRTVPGRVREKGDLWADILQRKNDLGSLLGS